MGEKKGGTRAIKKGEEEGKSRKKNLVLSFFLFKNKSDAKHLNSRLRTFFIASLSFRYTLFFSRSRLCLPPPSPSCRETKKWGGGETARPLTKRNTSGK